MLVIDRHELESFDIYHNGEKVTITLVSTRGHKAKFGIEGPRSFVVVRSELEVHDANLPLQSE